jgi:poly(A)-specific ribonuclease
VNPIASESKSTTIDRTFSVSSAAADFLRGCDFDFNAVFKKGIPYISRAEEKALIAAEEAKATQKFGTAKVDAQNEGFVKKVEADIREWLAQAKVRAPFNLPRTLLTDSSSLKTTSSILPHPIQVHL